VIILKREVQAIKQIRMFPSDWEELKRIKMQYDMPWPSFIKLINKKMGGNDGKK
jgi:hypothetical protein